MILQRLKKSLYFLVVSILLATITGVFLPPAKEARAAIALVQKKTASGTTSANIEWDSPTTAGNILIALVNNVSVSSGHNVTSPSGWVYATSATFGTYNQFQIFYKENAPSQSSTGNFTSSTGDALEVIALEYSGIAKSSSLDKSNATIATSPSTKISTGGSGVTSQVNELVVVGVGSASNVTFSGATNNFTIQQTLSQIGFLDRVVSSVGSYSASVTQSSPAIWGGLIATFKSEDAGSSNSAPSISAGPSDGGSYSGAPTTAGSAVTFTATATDSESDNYYLAICKTNSVTAVNSSAPTCPGGSWAVSSSTTSGSQASASHTTTSSNSGSQTWYAFVCDSNSSSLCSSSSQGSGNNGSPFVVTGGSGLSPTGIRVDVSTTGGDDTFNFITTGSGYVNFSITTLSSSGSDTQNGLAPGTYSLQQILPQGWNEDSFTCDNGTPDAIVVVDQQITTCSISNETVNPVPVIDFISPTGVSVGSTQVVITVTGSNFIPSSTVRFNSKNLATTFILSTKLTAIVQATELGDVCGFDVVVSNPAPGGGISNLAKFTISDLIPSISSISPSSRAFGLGAFTMTVNGTNFKADSVVNFNGQDQETTYVSSTKLTAKVLESYISRIGAFAVLVLNPTVECITSEEENPNDLTLGNPIPTTTSISPASVDVGGQSFVLVVNGTKFIPTSQVRINNQDRVTTYISNTRLTALINSSDILSPVSYNITVFNQSPGGGTSNARVLSVNSNIPSPTITSISPDSADVNGSSFTVAITGTNFVSNSQAKFNNQSRTTAYVSATQLTVQILDSDLKTGGLYDIIVSNSSSGGGVSNPKALSINNPLPTITNISPTSANQNGSAVIVTITGTNFVKNSKVKYDNNEKATTYVAATKQLRIVVTETDLLTAGSFDVVVTNPSPGGGTSNTEVFTIGSGGENQGNPSPTITSISPSSATAGDAGFNLTITGTNFIATSQAKFNNQNRTTTFVSSTSLKAQILSSDLTTSGNYNIVVVNPSPGGGNSNSQVFKVKTSNNIVKLTDNPCSDSSNFDEVVINSTSSTGVNYNFPNSKTPGTYYVSVYSPTGLSESAYAPYTWWNWPIQPPSGQRRVHGANIYLIKNDSAKFSPDPSAPPGGQRVSNQDIDFGGENIDVPPATGNVMTQVANTVRYFTASVDFKKGDFLTLIVNAIKISGNDIQGSYQKNTGSVHVRICSSGGGGGVLDGVAWASVTYGNGLFVAVGSDGGDKRKVMTSLDGVTWTFRTEAPGNESTAWSDITYGNGLFVAVGNDNIGGRVMTSPDGINWTSRTSATNNAWNAWNGVVYGNGLFVAVAGSGTGNRVMTSPDGIIWTSRTAAANNRWLSVTYGNGLFVAVSINGTGNRVMTSPDGITWTSRTSAADNIWAGVTYGNGLFVAVGAGNTVGAVMTSPDGINWTSRNLTLDGSLASVTYGNGLFVAVGNDNIGGRVMTSPDGINWTPRASVTDGSMWRKVTYGNGLFVAVGVNSTSNGLMISSDGITWNIL